MIKNWKSNQKLAEICGIHVGDGYLRNDGKRREWDISGNVEEKDYYDKHMIPLFNQVFNLNIKGKFFPSRNTYGFVIRDKKIIEFAHNALEFPYGKKTLIIQTPKFIFNNPKLTIHFIRGLFDTDGHITCSKRNKGHYSEFKRKYHHYPRAGISTVSPYLADEVTYLFKTLKINFCFSKHQPQKETENLKYRWNINGSKEVVKLINLIKPKNTTKTSKYSIWKKFGICPVNTTYQQRREILNGKINPYSFYKGP